MFIFLASWCYYSCDGLSGRELRFVEKGSFFCGQTDAVRKSGQALLISILLKEHFVRKTVHFFHLYQYF